MWEGFSTGFLLSFTILILLLVSKVKFRHIAATAGIVVLAAGLFYGTVVLYRVIKKDDNPSLTSTSRLATVEKRIGSFLTSDKDKELVENDQVVFSKVAIATGGIFGKIPGKGSLREVLPLSNSDYIFSIIVEETGLVGGTFVIGLYMWLLYSVIIIVRKCTKTFSAMLVCGLGILIVSQAMVHIMVNVGIIPVTGQTLPLISLGGSSVMATGLAFGMMLSVSRTLENEKKELMQDATEQQS
jgi:cell division protein FtsW